MSDLVLRDDDLTLRPVRQNAGFDGFAVHVGEDRVGSVALRDESSGTRSVRWNLGTGQESFPRAIRVLRLVMNHVFGTLGDTRLEARVPVDRPDDVRAASIAGLRREGILRGHGSDPDRVLLARLADDPPSGSRDGFIAILNAGLPTKRIIGQGLLRDAEGRVLLCELTYKKEWDLPGGVVEVGESPGEGLGREITEELGIDVEVGDLLTVNWLPAWRGWDDACIFLFDLGVADADLVDRMTYQATEIAAVHWCTPEQVREKATAAAIELLEAVDAGSLPTYREAPRAPE